MNIPKLEKGLDIVARALLESNTRAELAIALHLSDKCFSKAQTPEAEFLLNLYDAANYLKSEYKSRDAEYKMTIFRKMYEHEMLKLQTR